MSSSRFSARRMRSASRSTDRSGAPAELGPARRPPGRCPPARARRSRARGRRGSPARGQLGGRAARPSELVAVQRARARPARTRPRSRAISAAAPPAACASAGTTSWSQGDSVAERVRADVGEPERADAVGDRVAHRRCGASSKPATRNGAASSSGGARARSRCGTRRGRGR